MRAAKKFLESVETDAGIYHNGALIYKLGEKMDGFQIDSVKKLVDQVLNKYPKASIAVESDDVYTPTLMLNIYGLERITL